MGIIIQQTFYTNWNIYFPFERNKIFFPFSLIHPPVSEDPNCSFLAAQHQASVVISPSAVKTLLDNPAPNFDKEWDIPVVVRIFPVTGEFVTT